MPSEDRSGSVRDVVSLPGLIHRFQIGNWGSVVALSLRLRLPSCPSIPLLGAGLMSTVTEPLCFEQHSVFTL